MTMGRVTARLSRLALGLVLGTLGYACAPQRVLVAEKYVQSSSLGVKSMKVIRQLDQDGAYYDHVVRLCDLDAAGNEVTCKETVILKTKK
jgi:hypothetical protein